MKRALFVSVVVAVMVVSFWRGSNTEAQDATPDYLATIAALEAKIDKQATSIAKRDEKIDEQRTRIAELKGPTPTATPSELVFTGSGSQAFKLKLVGRVYFIYVDFGGGVLQLNIYGSDGVPVTSSMIFGPDQLSGSSTLLIYYTDEYVFDINSRSDWTIKVDW